MNILLARVENRVLQGDLGTGDPANILGRFFSSFWGAAYATGGIMFFLYLVWGGVEWVIAGSNEDRLKNAKNKIQNALFGLGLLAASFALVKLVENLFGINILNIDVSTLAP